MNKLLRVIPWLLIAITIIALGSVAGVFDADFKDHHDDFDVQFLRIDKAKSLDKQRLTLPLLITEVLTGDGLNTLLR